MTHHDEPGRRSVTGPDGRLLDVLVAGPPDGMPLVFHTGTPSGLAAFGPMTQAASDRGLRIVQYSRPGYGGSAPQPGRQIASAPADVAAILDQIGAGQFVTVGWSGGGPHALACAALLPGRCRAAASMAGVAPHDGAGLDWLAGMGPENIEEFGLAADGEAALTGFLETGAELLRGISAADLAQGMGGLSTGIAGWRDDDLAFVHDWGFSVADCAAVPVAIWQGGEDRMVPPAHGSWLAAHIPGSRARLLPAEGHLTLAVTSFGQILDDLVQLAGLELPAAG